MASNGAMLAAIAALLALSAVAPALGELPRIRAWRAAAAAEQHATRRIAADAFPCSC